jgi:hypothetical protein
MTDDDKRCKRRGVMPSIQPGLPAVHIPENQLEMPVLPVQITGSFLVVNTRFHTAVQAGHERVVK